MATSFQLIFSPPQRKPKRKVQQPEVKPELPAKLVLAPFSGTPEVNFGTVGVHQTVVKLLILTNPANSPIQVHFSNIDSTTDALSVSDSVLVVGAKEEVQLHLSWSPKCEGTFRKVVNVQDCNKTIRVFNVVVIGTCVDLSKANKSNKGGTKKKKIGQTPAKSVLVDQLNSTVTLTDSSNTPGPDRRHTFNVDPAGKENVEPLLQTSSPCLPVPYSNVFDTSFTPEHSFTELFNQKNSEKFRQCLAEPVCLASEEGRRTTYSIGKELIAPRECKALSPERKNVDLSKVSSETYTDSLESSLEQTDGVAHLLYPNDLFALSPPIKKKRYSASVKNRHAVVVSPLLAHRRKFFNSPKFQTPRGSAKKKSTNPTVKMVTLSTPAKIQTGSASKCRSSQRTTPFRKIWKRNTPSPKDRSTTKTPRKTILQTEDPFLKVMVYEEEDWIDRQEATIIKWMNSLLTPPVEIDQDDDHWSVDVVDLWMKSSQHPEQMKLAPSKEYFASVLYHCPQRLDALRKAANALYHSDAVATVLCKLSSYVNNKMISIREDRDLHLDQGNSPTLFLSHNIT